MLQSYHHCGAIWTMYSAYVTQAMPIWLFVVFNSFIHSIMCVISNHAVLPCC